MEENEDDCREYDCFEIEQMKQLINSQELTYVELCDNFEGSRTLYIQTDDPGVSLVYKYGRRDRNDRFGFIKLYTLQCGVHSLINSALRASMIGQFDGINYKETGKSIPLKDRHWTALE